MSSARLETGRSSIPIILLAGAIGLLGAVDLFGGVWLAVLGGSWAYAITGAAMLVVAALLSRRSALALHLFAAILLGTLVWAVAEIGFDWWPLVPRGDLVFILGALLATPWVTRRLRSGVRWPGARWPGAATPLVATLVIAAVVGGISLTRDVHNINGALPGPSATVAANYGGVPNDDWRAYARSWFGDKWSPLNQITPANVDRLQVAWQIHTGDLKRPGDPGETTYQVTPIKVGDTVYLCTPHDIVLALDAETGAQRWRYDPRIRVQPHLEHLTCRGVSYYDATQDGTKAVAGDCPQRILLGTNDARLIAIDAKTGGLCRSFGQGGQIDLLQGQTNYNQGWYQITSAPLVARGMVVIGGAVHDDSAILMPSGVIRAYDAVTGRLAWNFDPAYPDATAPLKPGQHYSTSSPNMWSTAAADDKLGLIYLPMGMGPVDQWGGNRPATTERFATTVLALDAATGKLRWSYQTVHHDLWDMDVPAQPALVDLTLPGRGIVPALVQSTKTGNLFVLDRRTGRPLFATPERPVPGGAAPGDHTSPTQPFSPVNLMPKRAVEADMWGATMLDQLWCRLRFRSVRYDGPYTPPSLQGSLVFPGNFGVMDWGGVSIDPQRQIAFAHPNYLAFIDKLVPRKVPHQPGGRSSAGSGLPDNGEAGYHENTGAPFGVEMNPFLSPLGLPCQAPPWGYVAGIDLRTGKVAWEHKNGTIRDETPLPIALKLGVPSLGGPMTTAGGVAFMSSAIDDYVRAYDVTTGKVLWRARLPAGGQASPMSYRSARSGRQFVIVVAGGHGSLGTKLGDNVIAYALPTRG